MKLLDQLYFDNSGDFSTDNIQTVPNGIPKSLKTFTIKNTKIKSSYPFYGLFVGTPNVIASGCSLPDKLEQVVQLADKVITLDLSYNSIGGTLSEKFCKVQNLNIFSNKLSGGPIPSCFYCHFKGNQALLDKINPGLLSNIFTNYNYGTASYPSCTSISVDLKFENGKTYLFGTDLGFDPTYFNTVPSATWNVDVPSVDIPQFDVTFIYPNQKFTVSALKLPVQVTQVYVSSSGQLSFTGSYFSNVVSSIKAGIVNGAGCTVLSSTFYSMVCQPTVPISSIQNLVDANFSITIGTQTAYIPITFIPDFTNRYLSCSEDCTNKGYCDRNSGLCICKGCNKSGDHGKCDIKNRKCNCDTFWIGVECNTPDHYVSSVVPSNIAGGNVTLNGWYGPIHNNPSVQIGNVLTGYKDCEILDITTSTIKCLIGAGTGRQNVIVTQNDHSWTGNGIYLYNETLMTCPNDCTNSTVGSCDVRFGNCICKTNYTGIDCGTRVIYQPPQSNTTVDQGSGSTNITNDGTKYIVRISKLAEISINQTIVAEYNLDPKKWNVTVTKNETDNTLYTFKQLVSKNTTVTYIIEEISMGDKNFTFADVPFLVTNGSIKLTVDVENYEYLTSLNTLQIQMISSVESIGERCIIEKAQINNIDQQSSLNYITISKEGKTLTGRFINRALSDGRPTYISSNVVSKDESSITVGLNLPHCIQCIIDPDFSVLVSSIKKNNGCETEEKERKWLLPVVIVIPVVGATAILIVSIVIYSKYRTALRLKLNSFLDPTIKMDDL
ncbi:hypothetical protein DICPUDRAFT_152238 [Dictyostelium purpureum]|uniref:EGF-like domain-containing protein n=1 Tax=Dictyostelium purpureum TaxID=5786 RepID=F0ZKU4_DICPU|nr:uncharacterized protein DICPUDRAFT_152238 [Dictyostelium purpureum]EGC35438.1 hypothetical protein DICPUDRAFT_152238 [Dictyostelium purpureum]|eukprot:XP_003288051.1 hypothetical protein DICPUDRAFT_152238 [Dictyostelium purpureum]